MHTQFEQAWAGSVFFLSGCRISGRMILTPEKPNTNLSLVNIMVKILQKRKTKPSTSPPYAFIQKISKIRIYSHWGEPSFEDKLVLKELYTLIPTFAQKLVLTILNNEFIFKNLNLTPFGRKIHKHFRPKIHKVNFSPN